MDTKQHWVSVRSKQNQNIIIWYYCLHFSLCICYFVLLFLLPILHLLPPLCLFHNSTPSDPKLLEQLGVSDAAAPIEIQEYALHLYLYAVKYKFSQGAEEKTCLELKLCHPSLPHRTAGWWLGEPRRCANWDHNQTNVRSINLLLKNIKDALVFLRNHIFLPQFKQLPCLSLLCIPIFLT